VFNILIIILSFISTISAAYFACFGFSTKLGFLIADIAIEFCFLFDIVLNFLLEYKDDQHKPVRDFKRIAVRYMKKLFIVDFLATIPFRYMRLVEDEKNERLFFLFKLFRLYKLKEVMDTKNFQDMVKSVFRRRLQ